MKTKVITRILALVLAALVIVTITACAAGNPPVQPADTHSASLGVTGGGDSNGDTSEASQQASPQVAAGLTPEPRQLIDKDREGNTIELPDSIEAIISLGPSNTEILVALGFAEKIIATDEYSANVGGIKPGISHFDMLFPDGELIISMQPDVMFVTGMGKDTTGDDPLKIARGRHMRDIYPFELEHRGNKRRYPLYCRSHASRAGGGNGNRRDGICYR